MAGTVNSISVSRGDILQAKQDNPTTGAHWDVIKDCSAEFKTAIEAAAGNRVKMLPGTYLITGDADPDARVNLTCDKGTVVVMNRLDNTVIDQLSNETYATSTTTQVAVTAVTLEDYTAPLTGNTSDYVTVFTCTTVGHAANFLKDTLAAVITDEPTRTLRVLLRRTTWASRSSFWMRMPPLARSMPMASWPGTMNLPRWIL